MRHLSTLLIALAFLTDAWAQFPAPYCTENYPSGVRPITRVSFGSINNNTPVTPAGGQMENFTNLTASIIIGSSYTITVGGSTGGNFTDFYNVFFDWNGDGDFGDAYEWKMLTTITNSTGSDNVTISAAIPVPETAVPGLRRMRVVKRTGATSFPCNTTGFGQSEDYSVLISRPPPRAIYVKATAAGTNNGSSWANAYTSLATAFVNARITDTIRVAAGTYKPGGSRTNSFNLQDSMIVLGGYPNTGNPTDAQRNFSTNQVILSGELGSPTYDGDNIIHVITGTQLSNQTLLDGFIIEKGYASDAAPASATTGGGIFLLDAAPSIRNCVFRSSYASQGGGALACENSSPLVSNCYFVKNYGEMPSTVVFNHLNSQPVFTNCVFSGNKGRLIVNNQSGVTLKHCTLVNNDIAYDIGALSAENNSTVSVSNSILYYNQSRTVTDSTDVSLSTSTATFVNTITQVYDAGIRSLQNANPKFRDTGNITGPDNLYFTSDDGLTLINPCSPAINAGSNAAAAGVTTDILGKPRVFGAITDLGAYEVQAALSAMPAVLFVNKLATGSNNGTSWANAFTDLQSALKSCSDTIKVAAGTYYPSANDPLSVFWLENKRIILGGYPATGNPGNIQRDPVAFPTILSGELPSSPDRSPTLIKGRWVDSTAVVDGFTIQKIKSHYFFNSVNYEGAAVHLIHHASPTIRNCTLKDNIGNQGGALITRFFSKPTFINSVFENNTPVSTQGYGSAVANYSNSAPRFLKCIFRFNETEFGSMGDLAGGAIINYNASPAFDSCTFSYNRARNNGGAIASFNNSNTVITNSFFHANYAASRASDIYSDQSTLNVSNTIFSDSTATGFGGAVALLNGSNAIFKGSQFKNGRADGSGGAVYTENSSAAFDKCLFYNNRADGVGGAICSVNSTMLLTNCVAVQNSCAGQDMKGSVLYNSKSMVTVVHCTFAFNMQNVIVNTDSTRLSVKNSVISNNASNTDLYPLEIASVSGQIYPPVVTMDHSLMEGYGTNGVDGNITGSAARFVDHARPAGADGIFLTADDGVALSRCSPAINAGENTAGGLTTDILGNTRQFGGTADMGAYEFLANPSTSGVIYVNATATGNNSGTSWSNAFTSLTSALNASCTDTIKIAAGTYKPIGHRDSSFVFNKAKVIWGGYPSSGNPTDAQRDPDLYRTILSGDIGIVNDSTDNNYHVVFINQPDTAVVIDGLTITRGNADGSSSSGWGLYGSYFNRNNGGGVLQKNGKLLWNNIRITRNYADDGAGYFNLDGKVDLNHTVFSNNHGDHWGGAYASFSNMNISSSISNSVFINNVSDYMGGAVFKEGAYGQRDSLDLKNNLFLGNRAYSGGAIYFDLENGSMNTSYSIRNSTFVDNATVSLGGPQGQGGAVYMDSDNKVAFYNNIFYNNSRGGTNSPGADIYDGKCVSFSPGCSWVETKNNILQTFQSYSFGNNLPTLPLFQNETDADGPDNKWFTADDGWQLRYNSPGVDNGNNLLIAGTTTDIIGNARIYGATVDLGPYEYSNLPFANAGPDSAVCAGNLQIGMPGNPNHTYSWTSNPAGFTSAAASPVVSPSVSTTYYLQVSNGTVVAKDTVIITINTSSPAAVTIVATATTICTGSSVTFTATPVNGGSSPAYQWQVNGVNAGTNSPVFTTSSLTNLAQVKVIMTSNSTCATTTNATSNIITMAVSNVVPAVSITASATTVCTGNSITFTATPVNGGANPAYQWQVNNVDAGTNSPVFTTSTLTNGSVVKVILTSNAACASPATTVSNIITVTVSGAVAPSVTVAASATTICQGTSVSFTAAPVNGGTPSYQWLVNGANAGTNNPVFTTTTLTNGSEVKVVMTSNLGCASPSTATSSPVTITVTSTVVPSVSVTASSTSVCAGENISFTAAAANAGTNPVFQWKVNGNTVGTNSNLYSSNTLANNDVVTVSVTGNANCSATVPVSSSPVTITVSAVTPVITISGNTSVTQNTAVTITSTVSNGGASPAYQWQDSTATHGWQNIQGGTMASLLYTPLATGDRIRNILSGNAACATSATATSNVLVFSVSSGIVANGVLLYPNPTVERITIDSLQLADQWAELAVISSNGSGNIIVRNITGQRKVVIFVGALAPGMYYIRLTGKGEKARYLKFIKL